MNFEKQIWKLFKMNRDNFNKADIQIGKILIEVYAEGKKQGANEERKRLKGLLTGRRVK
jgi:hypothetical protein